MENHADVIPSVSFDEALAHIETAERLAEELNGLYVTRVDSARIAKLHRQQTLAIQLAKVSSHLAIADEIRALREMLNDEPGPWPRPVAAVRDLFDGPVSES